MVVSVTSFGRNGLSDWIIQRVSAVVLAAYTIFIIGYLLLNPDLTYAQWSAFFEQISVRIFTLMALLS
ncbi:MAG: succinate dehydrogenase / fumarate reductase membrane anchor subunit, partial [Oleiphilaceae bacterium]